MEWLESIVKVGYKEYLFWFGPRLMYSIGKNGFSNELKEVIKGISNESNNIVLVWFLGEIDIRVFGKDHYYGKAEQVKSTVDNFLNRIANDFANCKNVITIPTVPSDFKSTNPEFPRVGSLQQRLSVFEMFKDEVLQNKLFPVFDPNQLVGEKVLSSEVSDYGAHFNFSYSLKMRKLLYRYIIKMSL